MPGSTATSLPRLFVIGDSISLHYGPHLARFVAGNFSYARKQDEAGRRSSLDSRGGAGSSLDYPSGAYGENAGDSGMVLEYLRAATKDSREFREAARLDDEHSRARSNRHDGGLHPLAVADVVLLNCGLHDLKRQRNTLRPQVGLDQYSENLTAIAELVADEPYRLVWITTTPVHDATHAAHSESLGFTRHQKDVERYNSVATAVMRAQRVPIVDLHAFTVALGGDALGDLYQDHVHFVERVRVAQAAFLAGWMAGRVG